MTAPATSGEPTVRLSQTMEANRPRVAAVQDGSRGHYGMPIALHRAGILERMFTDGFIKSHSSGSLLFSWLKALGLARRTNGRRCPELDSALILQNHWLAVRERVHRFRCESIETHYEWLASLTERWILAQGFGEANALMGFVRNVSPGLCAAARREGLMVAADQMISPAAVENREMARQQKRWPGWEPPRPADGIKRLQQYEELTWDAVDHITCPSDYVRQGLIKEGIIAEKISVIHYPIDENSFVFQDRQGRPNPVVVGFVGAVGLRKGAPYFLEVAKRFNPKEVRFVMVGPVHLNKSAVEKFAGHVEVVGGVPRSEVAEWVRRFDIMLFPSTCEGSAYALMEAMASGLPGITSPNSGTVARHGQEGFMTPYDDINAMAGYVQELLENPSRRLEMGRAARKRYEECNLESYSRELSALFYRLVGSQPISSARGQ
jgi:glycosyltransferase involved in cell wall biosynthesis